MLGKLVEITYSLCIINVWKFPSTINFYLTPNPTSSHSPSRPHSHQLSALPSPPNPSLTSPHSPSRPTQHPSIPQSFPLLNLDIAENPDPSGFSLTTPSQGNHHLPITWPQSPPPPSLMMIKTGVWNIRGLGTTLKRDSVRNLIYSENLSLLCLVETRATQDHFISYTQEIMPNWKFVNNYSYAPNGRIWVGWNPSELTFTKLNESDQHIHGEIWISQIQKRMLITAVYAHNYGRERRRLWETLNQVNHSGIPWIALGDFNIIRFLSEKFGGSEPCRENIEEFNNCIMECSLSDLKSLGQTLSWSNSTRVGNYKLRRLDRAIVNDDWLSSFPSSFADYTSPILPDHSPIVIHLQDRTNRSPKPCRFYSMWLDDLSLFEIVERTWNLPIQGTLMFRVTQKLKRVKYAIKTWNRDVFGRIDIKLPLIKKGLEAGQAMANADPGDCNMREYVAQTKEKYLRVANQEESMLKQRAQINWLALGDSNSHFFHAAINSSINRTSIHGTTDDRGETVSDPHQIEDIFVRG
ncbi:uncharacterized protein LOC143869954 [Tasmannia lanceolata]|uniref:uncharacterized protein LOC143869954 n=1 Tax=Tasmannia lanceolata TaxID=3420 RepID=UPI0040633E4A